MSTLCLKENNAANSSVDLMQWVAPSKQSCLVAQSCLTLCNLTDCSPRGSPVHGILQAKILECSTISFSRESSQPRDQTCIPCIAGRSFTIWATREAVNTQYIVKLLVVFGGILFLLLWRLLLLPESFSKNPKWDYHMNTKIIKHQ